MFESLTLDEPASTVDRVADELRRAVFEGELESGTPLREHGLAESLGVGRSTVREALTILVAEGLATRAPNKGVAVATPEAASVRDVCAARWVLEGAGVRNWGNASTENRKAVHDSLDAYISAVHSDHSTYRELNERHLAFHLSLVALTGSPRLVAMQEHLVLELKLALAQVDRIRRNAHDQAEDHAALVRLLDADHIDDAERFLQKHLSDAAHSICRALGLER
ncbi:GntR family transcriptional regulator [Nocardioides panzhihuensis]|uniref:DNA-binding GntR family transcriptional regulator n=1 Tax=Nocardioides panzhihuensis TaxID=860243 RepID=A0A7Z0DQI0_9ACTN|nr:GntR family transcriptional regulator [Nocardioides panzhihuensis]NYI79817.1 DNA-binding GntR family transcriptional regulator [Nocardioides panzhihuensis]